MHISDTALGEIVVVVVLVGVNLPYIFRFGRFMRSFYRDREAPGSGSKAYQKPLI